MVSLFTAALPAGYPVPRNHRGKANELVLTIDPPPAATIRGAARHVAKQNRDERRSGRRTAGG